jgi:hypothetical protein
VIPAAINPPLTAGCNSALGGSDVPTGRIALRAGEWSVKSPLDSPAAPTLEPRRAYMPLLERIGLKLPSDKSDTGSLVGAARSPWSAPGT